MKKSFELTIDSEYVLDWGIVEAFRELFQNALDEQVTHNNPMYYNYNPQTQLLVIGNTQSVLPIESLLIGRSTKRGDDTTIGNHGEGYKLATIVLLRLGKTVKFINNALKQIWTPRLRTSRKYGGVKVPVFDVEQWPVWTRRNNNGLCIQISGVTNEEYALLVENNLSLQDDIGEHYDTYCGTLLCDPRYAGKVFVSGLFVCNNKDLSVGYSFKPNYLKLDRDRRTVASFELQWETSRLLSIVANTYPDVVTKLLGSPDTRYLGKTVSLSEKLADSAVNRFVSTYGNSACPVSSDTDIASLVKVYQQVVPIVVSDVEYKILTSSNKFKWVNDTVMGLSDASKFIADLCDKYEYAFTDEELRRYKPAMTAILSALRTVDTSLVFGSYYIPNYK